MKISNMYSNQGNQVANQFYITGLPAGTFFDGEERLESGEAFQSYQSMIAYKTHNGRLYLDADKWDYSVTTGRYRNQFTGLNVAETRKAIESGEIKLIDLNS